MANNGYLEKDRLAHVIAAIQIMAVTDAPSGGLNRWIGELDAGEAPAEGQRDRPAIHYADRKKWSAVFDEHPEFFKSYTVKGEPHVALRMRLAQSQGSAPDAGSGDGSHPAAETASEVTAAEDAAAPAASKSASPKSARPASVPLTPEQIDVLINTAIKLHNLTASDARTPDRDRGARWLFSAAGAVVGSIVAGTLVAFMVWSPVVVQIFD